MGLEYDLSSCVGVLKIVLPATSCRGNKTDEQAKREDFYAALKKKNRYR
jgi:hypothetical protein